MTCVLVGIEGVLSEPRGDTITTHLRSDTGVLLYHALLDTFDVHLVTTGRVDLAEAWLSANGFVRYASIVGPLDDEPPLETRLRAVATLRRQRLYVVIDQLPLAVAVGVAAEIPVLGFRAGTAARLLDEPVRVRTWDEVNGGVTSWVAAPTDDRDYDDDETSKTVQAEVPT